MNMLKTIGLAAALSVATCLASGVNAADLPKNLRIVIGSNSTGGDTYQSAEIVARALSKETGINVKVDAVGANEAFRAISRDRRGTTMMVFHDQTYLAHLYDVPGYKDIFTSYRIGPTVMINPGNAYLVPKSSPYKSLQEILDAVAAGKKVRVAIEPGGVSEIGLSALEYASKLNKPGSEANFVPVRTGSQADKNQLLFDGQADVIHGSVQGNEQFTQLDASDQKAMRFVWVTASGKTIEQLPAKGMGHTSRDDLLKFVAPNVKVPLTNGKSFVFDKEFFFLYNKDIDPSIAKAMDDAVAGIFAKGEVQKTMEAAFYVPDFKPSAEAEAYLKDKAANYAEIIKGIASSR